VPGHPKGDESALGIFSRSANTGTVKQLSGRACVERQDPPRDLGCATARNLLGLRFVTVSPDDRFLYTTGATGITIFRRNLKAGTVTALPGQGGCLSTTTVGCTQLPGSGGVEDLAITRDGTQAYASGSGNVLTFARDPRTGTLTLRSCFGEHSEGIPEPGGCALGRGIVSSRSVTLSPDERFVYIASLEDALAIFARNPRTGQLTQLTGVDGCINTNGKDGCAIGRAVDAPHRLTITSNGRFAYLAGKHGGDSPRSSLDLFRRDPARGTLTQLPGKAGCINEDGHKGCALGRGILGAHAAILDMSERTLYLASDREAGIAVFRRNTTTGELTQFPGKYGCLSGIPWEGCAISRRMGGVHFLVLSNDGRFVYAAGENSEALVVLRVLGRTG
jgi:hypothetical protein